MMVVCDIDLPCRGTFLSYVWYKIIIAHGIVKVKHLPRGKDDFAEGFKHVMDV